MEKLAGPTGQTTTQASPMGDAFSSTLRDVLAGMAMGSTPQESMAYGGRMAAINGPKRELAQQKLTHQNQTLQFLTGKGVDPNTATYLASDPEAMRAWFAESQKGQTPQWKMGEIFDDQGRPQKIMYDERNPSRFNVIGGAKSDAITPDAEAQKIRIGQASKPETHITVGGGKFGTIPPGYELRETPEGAQMVPIPGGPAANELAEKQKKANETSVLTKRSGDIVLEDIDKAIGQSKKGGAFGIPVTGVGAKLSGTPGTAAHDLENTLNTIKANVSFDRLQQMRQSSPTGGALGAVTPPELMLLQSTLGAVEQSQSQEQFVQNMERLSRVYKDIVHGPGANPGGGGSSVASSGKVRRYNPQTGKIE